MNDDVTVVLHLSKDVYRALIPAADRRGTQIHTMLEQDVTRAVHSAPKKRTTRSALLDSHLEAVRHFDAIARLHATGLSDSAIARELGISQGTANRYRRALGLPANVPQRGGRKKREATS